MSLIEFLATNNAVALVGAAAMIALVYWMASAKDDDVEYMYLRDTKCGAASNASIVEKSLGSCATKQVAFENARAFEDSDYEGAVDQFKINRIYEWDENTKQLTAKYVPEDTHVKFSYSAGRNTFAESRGLFGAASLGIGIYQLTRN